MISLFCPQAEEFFRCIQENKIYVNPEVSIRVPPCKGVSG
jgi:hypothetical protein